ncbi:hypothetical protein N658DRAFT_514956 [Parathielavia hyrcaniae]|uniref:BHLH domain-containing protein n=1 Tax=Parathielavia hyrcaniae TaxID=113614 RepID=A0AAN6Q4S3_9PEZI|nr:hypothetical protein N658DRAFT_514956 [Parathielavia hyrcaniae]
MSAPTLDSAFISFNPSTASFDTSELETYSDFSPMSIFDTEDFSADFPSDAAASPLSALSPALSATSLCFPTTDPWAAWDGAGLSPEPDLLFGCQAFAPCSPSGTTMSPAIDPIDLAVSAPTNPSPQPPQVTSAITPAQQHQQHPIPVTATHPTPPTTTDAAAKRYPSRSLKRKSRTGPSEEKQPASKSTALSPSTTTTTTPSPSTSRPKHRPPVPGPKKTPKSAHNMIEKRYRTNLNDKITQLRDAVPSLRQLAQQRAKNAAAAVEGAGQNDDDEDDEEECGADSRLLETMGSCGLRLNKATILSKATEYILQLERWNQRLEAENGALRGRMEGLEVILMGHARRGVVGAGGWD